MAQVSGAALGMLLLRASALPDEPLDLGAISLRPLRAILLHVLLDGASNSL